ncbi:MarR family EPS-associated transcriptional regulator [Acidithiobacillus ferrooxidans]|uniref:MarR family EPS-associated transcriptional regulator n=1 Tax=Acidithiobacillus ferrooxidans TaxID=920 RepID=UPI00214AE99A|nr:MarR family EPS-associated transcriptional regulator [Acidithiobacillus ferrooxidans]MCR2831771.1 MarR family EPS-associated transcriptional regulator [Acidithiobacillus ferrooxidans]
MTLDDATRYQLLKLIEAHPDYSQREIAAAMGVSVGKLNYCLKAIVHKGWVKMGKFRSKPGKRSYPYLLTPQGIEEKARVTVRFLQHKMDEYENLKIELKRLHAEAAEEVFPTGGTDLSGVVVDVS